MICNISFHISDFHSRDDTTINSCFKRRNDSIFHEISSTSFFQESTAGEEKPDTLERIFSGSVPCDNDFITSILINICTMFEKAFVNVEHKFLYNTAVANVPKFFCKRC